ncbi:hypothetical protein BMF94_6384 [Rhodotorula taiwanensis]|uniref:Uncharacterized protein n=1 Tax=Rhodotorula taiwanensis TaxID=741276 RepID=A0A2S5B1G8_9BASI|nr:hypothetical protein BMF94_6384 [Rhodotorula taiwanensis]
MYRKSFGARAASAVMAERTKLEKNIVAEYEKQLQQAISGGAAAADRLVNESKQHFTPDEAVSGQTRALTAMSTGIFAGRQEKLAQFSTDKARFTLVNDPEQYSYLVSKLQRWAQGLVETSERFADEYTNPDDELFQLVEEKFTMRIQDNQKMQKQTNKLVIRLLSEYRSFAAQSYETQRETYKLLKETARA